MHPSLKYRNNKVDYHSAEAKRVLNDAHGSPIYGTLAALNKSPDGIPLDCDYDCEHWLHSAVASMYADVTVETLAPSIKSDCHQCALAICNLFEKNRLLHSPDGTRNERIWTVPRPTLWTLHQMLPNKDPETGGALTFYLRINDIVQTFVEQFSYQEKRDLILVSLQTASTTPGGINLTPNNLGREYVRLAQGNLASAGIHLIRYVAYIEDDDTSIE